MINHTEIYEAERHLITNVVLKKRGDAGVENPKISVVLPIYNEGWMLEDCLNALTGQTLSEIEILCINDGSEDDSLEQMLSWAERDRRITVLSQENRGMPSACNHGVEIAAGEYLYFCSAGQILRENTLEHLYQQAKKQELDLLCFRSAEQIPEDSAEFEEAVELEETEKPRDPDQSESDESSVALESTELSVTLEAPESSAILERAESSELTISAESSVEESTAGTGWQLFVQMMENGCYQENPEQMLLQREYYQREYLSFAENSSGVDHTYLFRCLAKAERAASVSFPAFAPQVPEEFPAETAETPIFRTVYGYLLSGMELTKELMQTHREPKEEEALLLLLDLMVECGRETYGALAEEEQGHSRNLIPRERHFFEHWIGEPVQLHSALAAEVQKREEIEKARAEEQAAYEEEKRHARSEIESQRGELRHLAAELRASSLEKELLREHCQKLESAGSKGKKHGASEPSLLDTMELPEINEYDLVPGQYGGSDRDNWRANSHVDELTDEENESTESDDLKKEKQAQVQEQRRARRAAARETRRKALEGLGQLADFFRKKIKDEKPGKEPESSKESSPEEKEVPEQGSNSEKSEEAL